MGNRMERRETKYFAVERLMNTGRELQFYEHMEICCVEKGTVFVVVSGESEYLSEGQIVIIDPFENYSIERLEETSILILSIGTSYLRYFFSLYPGKKLPRWLMDSQFNRKLYDVIQKCSAEAVGEQNELRMTGIVCDLLSDVIERYGMEQKNHDSADDIDLVAKIVKYENNLIVQEKLENAIIVPYVHTRNGTVKEYLSEKGICIDEKLLGEILNTKVQIGRDKKGDFKFFDYEDAKVDHKDILEMFRMKEDNIDQFFKYVHEYDINHITQKDTFEDYRKHIVNSGE